MSTKALAPTNLFWAAADPATPTLRAGDVYGNSGTSKLRLYNGSAWTDVTGTPASSVVAETTYGLASTAGLSSNYARQDHSHGTPPAVTVLAGTSIGVVAGLGFDYTVSIPNNGVGQAQVNFGYVDLSSAQNVVGVKTLTGGGLGGAYGSPSSNPALNFTNTTAATSGTQTQVPGAMQFQANYWDGAASQTTQTRISTDVYDSSGHMRMRFGADDNWIYGTTTAMGLMTATAGIYVPPGQPFTTGTRSVVTGTRTTTTSNVDTVDLGTFSTTGGAMELRIHAHLAAPAAGTTASVTKVYEFAANATMGYGQAITGVTFVSTTVTVTVASTVGLPNRIQLAGIGGLTNVNGRWSVATVVDATHFTVVVATTPTGAYTSGGWVGGWYKMLPADASGNLLASNDFTMEVQRTAVGVFLFQFRQISIAVAGAITFTVESLGDVAVTFTPSTTVTAGPLPVTALHPSNGLTLAAGNVGIGTDSPTTPLHVYGTATFADTSGNTVMQVTGTDALINDSGTMRPIPRGRIVTTNYTTGNVALPHSGVTTLVTTPTITVVANRAYLVMASLFGTASGTAGDNWQFALNFTSVSGAAGTFWGTGTTAAASYYKSPGVTGTANADGKVQFAIFVATTSGTCTFNWGVNFQAGSAAGTMTLAANANNPINITVMDMAVGA